MTKTQKLLLAGATLFPLLVTFSFVAFFILGMAFLPSMGNDQTHFGIGMLAITVLVIMAISTVLLVIYLVHLLRNATIDPIFKLFWGIAFFFFGGIAMLIYWYLYIWIEHPATSNVAQHAG